jgi:hypothetical protein
MWLPVRVSRDIPKEAVHARVPGYARIEHLHVRIGKFAPKKAFQYSWIRLITLKL